MTNGLRGRGILRWSGLVAAMLAVAISARAAVGPPPLLERGALDLGAEVGTLGRELEIQGTVGGGTIRPHTLNSSQTTLNLRADYALTDNLQARVLVGTGWINLGQFEFVDVVSLGRQDMDGDAGFLWGLGGAYVVSPLATTPDVRVGLSGEYRHYTSEVNLGEIEIDEFRVALQVAWPMDRITLYGGPVYSDIRGSFEARTSLGFPSNGILDAAERVGVLAGAEYQFSPRLAGRVEGEFLSSTGVNLSVVYGMGGPSAHAPRRVAAPSASVATASDISYAPSASATDWGAPPPSRHRAGADAAASAAPPAPSAAPARPAATAEGESRRLKPPTPPAGTHPPRNGSPSRSEPAATEPRVVPASELRASENIEALLAAGAEAARMGRYDEAITYYRRAVAADPGEFRAVYNLATAQYLAHDYAGAQASYEAAIMLRPGDVESHLFLGFCHYRQRRPEDAARAWRRVLEIDPSNSIAFNNLQALGY